MTPEDILRSKNIHYRTSGSDLVVNCLNPEHEDKNPSMRIDSVTGMFHCLSCGYKGVIYNIFGVYRNLVDVRLQSIKDKINKLTVPKLYLPLIREPFYKKYRGISKETYKKFDAFTTSSNDFDDSDDRVIFPIYNIYNDIECFIGRYINTKASPRYRVYPRGISVPMYPASPDILDGAIILVEGLFDMLNLHDKGLTNAVAIFGSNLGKDQVASFSIYKMQGVTKVYVMLDGDEAGRRGTKDIMSKLRSNYIVESIDLPDGVDPGSLNAEDIKNIKDYYFKERT